MMITCCSGVVTQSQSGSSISEALPEKARHSQQTFPMVFCSIPSTQMFLLPIAKTVLKFICGM